MKTFDNYATAATQKAIKSAARLICTTADDGFIYLASGYWMLRMTPAEYAAVAQGATKCDPGNWNLDSTGKRDHDGAHFLQIFRDAVTATVNAPALDRAPLLLDRGTDGTASLWHNSNGLTAAYNAAYLAALAPGYQLRSTNATSPAVAYSNGEPFALVMPIRLDAPINRAISALFDDAAPATNDEITQLKATNAQLTAELESLRTRLAQQETQTQQPATDTRTAAEQVAARFADLDGVTTTIKGAQTAAPVIWLTGNTDPHADAIKAAGGRWSNKRSAYYVRVA